MNLLSTQNPTLGGLITSPVPTKQYVSLQLGSVYIFVRFRCQKLWMVRPTAVYWVVDRTKIRHHVEISHIRFKNKYFQHKIQEALHCFFGWPCYGFVVEFSGGLYCVTLLYCHTPWIVGTDMAVRCAAHPPRSATITSVYNELMFPRVLYSTELNYTVWWKQG